jgi:sec-independent protein translocase protein TatB
VSFSETLFLFFLALVVFGPKKLPEIARQVGKILNEFRRASNEFKSQIEQEIAHLEVEDRKKAALQASPAPAGTTSRTLNAAPSEPVPATLAASSEAPAGSNTTESVIATEAVASTEPVSADAVTSASSESSSVSQGIPKEGSQDTSQNHFQDTQAESTHESQESHA